MFIDIPKYLLNWFIHVPGSIANEIYNYSAIILKVELTQVTVLIQT